MSEDKFKDNFADISVPVEKIDEGAAPRCSLDVRIQVDAKTVIDAEVLRLQSFSGQEGISEVFEFKLELRANDYTMYDSNPAWEAITESGNQEQTLNLDTLLGAPITVLIGLPETDEERQFGLYPEGRKVSYFNGIIYSVSMLDRGVWNISMKPRVALLSLQSSYRIFEDKTILEVITDVLEQNYIEHTPFALDSNKQIDQTMAAPIVGGLATYRRQDWLQAGETDFDFLTRLMGKAGIIFYFVHSLNAHTMVLTDQNYYQTLKEPSAEVGVSDSKNVRYLYLTGPVLGQELEDNISQFNFQRSLAVKGVSTILARKQGAWESEDPAEAAPVYRDDRLSQNTLSMEKMHVVSYGASEQELKIRNDLLQRQLISAKSSLSGSSGLADLRSGYIFALKPSRSVEEEESPGLALGQGSDTPAEHYRNEFVTEMVAVSVSHNATADGKYSNQFTAYDSAGFGKPYDASGDSDGSIIAQVCDKTSSEQMAKSSPMDKVSKFVAKTITSKFFMPKTAFVDKQQKSFTAVGADDPTYTAQGVYVQFISRGQMSDPVWVRLSDSMTTIPERGTFVMVSRARDETEVPQIDQVLDSVGSRNIMPQQYSKSTSWGDSYSTNYGDSYRVSVPQSYDTDYDVFTGIVNDEKAKGLYDDVSFSESSSSSFSVAKLSRSISVAGNVPDGTDLTALYDEPSDVSSYVQASRSVTYGSSYNRTEQTGEQKNYTTTSGDSFNKTIQSGKQTSETEIHGESITKSRQTGRAFTENVNTVTETVSNTDTNISNSTTGYSSDSSTTGASDSNTVVGSSSTTSLTGLSSATNLTVVNMSSDITGVTATTSATGASASVSVTGVSGELSLTGSTNYVRINGPGYHYEDNGETPKAETTAFEVNMIITLKIDI